LNGSGYFIWRQLKQIYPKEKMIMIHCQIRKAVAGLALLVLAWNSGAAMAQESHPGSPNTLSAGDDFKSPPATIEDLVWFAGAWRGEAMGGEFEETWNRPLGDSMSGLFRMVEGGKTVFSEHMMLMPQDGSLVVRLKHFDAQLHGWEEKDKTVDFRLLKIDGKTAWFNGLTYRMNSPDSMDIFVRMKSASGEISELHFPSKRVPLEPENKPLPK
jgi:Domain of unknown function (DUF6265)